jgi:hypothetical protein
VQIRVRTSQASDWGASVPVCDLFADEPRPKLFMTADTLKVKGVFPLPSGKTFGDVAPLLKGAHVLVEGASGGIGADVTLPPGDYAGRGTRGWTANASGSTWTYRDRTGTPLNGITKLSIQDLGSGNVRVKVTGKHGTYDLVAADMPLHVVVDLGDATDAAVGLCGQSSA